MKFELTNEQVAIIREDLQEAIEQHRVHMRKIEGALKEKGITQKQKRKLDWELIFHNCEKKMRRDILKIVSSNSFSLRDRLQSEDRAHRRV
jgi:hypothetical protein